MIERVKESDFQAAVIDLAEWQGWRVYHTHDSRGSQPGFPDLTMVRPPQLIFAELKIGNANTTHTQDKWLNDLGDVPGILVFLWRPSDWPGIECALKHTGRALKR